MNEGLKEVSDSAKWLSEGRALQAKQIACGNTWAGSMAREVKGQPAGQDGGGRVREGR